ncbi:unnamed protein product [Cuscuta europaea]|nr:unnamed protein product [Cuscuta europaea]
MEADGLFNPDDDLDLDVNAIYADLIQRATKGTRVLSMKAPALSTEFVRSSTRAKAQASQDGALIAIEFPSRNEVRRRQKLKHGDKKIFGYAPCEEADSFPSGYGERSAQSMQREDSVYQLKSAFTSAAIAMSKLRARVNARGGDATAISKIFALMWGISEDEAGMIPNLEVTGKESTHLAALEDCAFHSLSGHPAYSGGYRVDIASITSEELGENVPVNWARIRTRAKAIAQVQVQGDLEFRAMKSALPDNESVPLLLEITLQSQPIYRRTYPWEGAMLRAMRRGEYNEETREEEKSDIDVGCTMMQTYSEAKDLQLALHTSANFTGSWKRIASIVRDMSRRTLTKTVKLIEMHQIGRALLADEEDEDAEELEIADMGKSFEVPPFKITRDRLTTVMSRNKVGSDALPDIKSQGRGTSHFSLAQ